MRCRVLCRFHPAGVESCPAGSGEIVEVTVGDEGEENLFDWFSPKRKSSERSEYGRAGWSQDFLNDKACKRSPARDKELTAAACATFPELLPGDKLPEVVWEPVQEHVSKSDDDDQDGPLQHRQLDLEPLQATGPEVPDADSEGSGTGETTTCQVGAGSLGGRKMTGWMLAWLPWAAGGGMEASTSGAPLNQENFAGGNPVYRECEVPITFAYSRRRLGTQG